MASEAAPVPSSRAREREPSARARQGRKRAVAGRRLLGLVVAAAALALLVTLLWARLFFPSDRTPEGAYLRVVIAVNRGRAEDFFAYTEPRAHHAGYTSRDYRKKTRARVLASFPEPERSKLAADYAEEAAAPD